MALITMATLYLLASLVSLSAAQSSDDMYVTIQISNRTVEISTKDFQKFYDCLSGENHQSCQLKCKQNGRRCSLNENLIKGQTKQGFIYKCWTSLRKEFSMTCFKQNASTISVTAQSFRRTNSTLPCASLIWSNHPAIKYEPSVFESCSKLTHNSSAPTSKSYSDDAISSDHSGVIIFVVVKFVVFVAICVIVGIVGRAEKISQAGDSVRGLAVRLFNSRGADDQDGSERGTSPSPSVPLQRTALIPPNYTHTAVAESSPDDTNHVSTSPVASKPPIASLQRTAPISTNSCIALGENTDIDSNRNSSDFMEDTSIKSSNLNSAEPNDEASMSTESTSVASPVSHTMPCPILTSENGYCNLPINCTGSEADDVTTLGVRESIGGYVELEDETLMRQGAEGYDSLGPYTAKIHYSPLCARSSMDKTASDFALASSFNRDSTDYYTNVRDLTKKTVLFSTVDEKYVELSDESSAAPNENLLIGQGSKEREDDSAGYVNLDDETLPAHMENDNYYTVKF